MPCRLDRRAPAGLPGRRLPPSDVGDTMRGRLKAAARAGPGECGTRIAQSERRAHGQPPQALRGSRCPARRDGAPSDPERIVFDYPLAGPFRRFTAYLIDLALMALLVVAGLIVSMLLSFGTVSGAGPALVAYFLITWGYGAFCEGVFSGQTPGKRALGLRAVSDRGVPMTGAQAVLRNLVRVADGLVPFCFLLGLSSMLVTRKFQRLGDLAAGTMVIVEDRRPRLGLVRMRDREIMTLVDRLPVRIAAGSSLARALSDYARRRHRFGVNLREELAEPLARPLRARFGLPAGRARRRRPLRRVSPDLPRRMSTSRRRALKDGR